ncbi:cell wall-active antibiotics response protein LiaF [Brevibacillus formosus]|uniref:Membrane protein n=1 Tax=Brevibacillus formosus TaxID=54913 RepID=A0A837KK77_9BACL|nr:MULTISPECIES: cell wall-active antibiotics response protein LiaF [Brevibacillus]KLH96699.1 membrane protein [Brevibacillus formosus]MED1948776.1 cell wall-active antibiotics response protein LiaF [Brevibacillus formosus]MED1960151.1 cell wall-active antibiotics response protein LiaF [Brevibacillus formosus]MED2001299.1 cell wall-active antibiotics response protein LiaF [Brevibacillus formosus]MED2085383.1 cell wall-active antibiotics response protein LiaF [Brevibacillus formosus]
MKLSRLHKMLAGVLIIFTGIGLLLDSLGIISFGLFDLWPMVLIYFGLRLWGQKNRIGGGILFSLGTIIAMDMWFGVGIDDLFQIAVPIVFIYFGFQLIRGKNSRRDNRVNQPLGESGTPSAAETIFTSDASVPNDVNVSTAERPWVDSWNKWKHVGGKIPHHERMSSSPDDMLPKDSRSSLIGDYHLTSGRFELNHLHVWHGIGDVVIDLSRAVLMRDEAVLVVEGWVGDVTIYVPVDLPVSVTAGLSIGDLEVLSHRQGGINRSVKIRSDQYDEALQKVNLHISLLVGDIKVKYI